MAKSGKDAATMIRQRSGSDEQVSVLSGEQERPGPVQTKATIRLHTFIAHQLFFGRQDDPNRVYRDQCFVTFAANLNALWTCAQADDPYADARLIQIEEQIERARESIKNVLHVIEELLMSLHDAGIRTESHASVRPVDVPIAFRAVHAAVAVQLLGLVDRAIQKALAARHFGLVTMQDWQRILSQTSTPMRHLFELSRFRASGATRDDFAANNARARTALEKLGQLPADILQGLRRPVLGPRPSRSLVFSGGAEVADDGSDSLLGQSLKALDQLRPALAPMAKEAVPMMAELAEGADGTAEMREAVTVKRVGGGRD